MKMTMKMQCGAMALWVVWCISGLARANVCPEGIYSVPTLRGGRVKPLLTHARETIRFITGSSSYEGFSAVEVYCRLSLQNQFQEVSSLGDLPIKVDHLRTKQVLGIPADAKVASLSAVIKNHKPLRELAVVTEGREGNTPLSDDIHAVLMRVRVLHEITSGLDWQIPVLSGEVRKADGDGSVAWQPLGAFVQEKGVHSSEEFFKAIAEVSQQYAMSVDDTHLLEATYEKLHLFEWAIVMVLVSLAVVALMSNLRNPAVWVAVGAVFVLELLAISFRVVISGRAPVSNMLETVMWVGFGAMLFAAILAFVKKTKLILVGGLVLNLGCLFMMMFARNMLDASIKPLVPVLRDNFWLATHVTSVTISYAAFGLSWFVSNTYMIRGCIGKLSEPDQIRMAKLCHDRIKIGVVLLAAGIILGGVWADYSWGRFWGWDPKETWSLVALLAYITILHGRFSGWVKAELFVPLVGLAFLTILMAWFGVNSILASGLHSYGFSTGGAVFIITLAVLQILVFILFLTKRLIVRR